MNVSTIKKIAVGFGFAMFGAMAVAGDKGNADEAIAMVKKAKAYINANGPEKAFAEFNNPKGQFVDRDLYIAVFDMNGVSLAHGANPRLIGKNLMELKDADGKAFIKNSYEVVAKNGSGWSDYKWVNPVTKAIEQKSTYSDRIGDYLVACGIYK
jgi:signal transduction histidine kinase